MRILSIETSCDDTGISILEVHPARNRRGKGSLTNASFKVLADASNSQINIHRPHGGVFPKLAKREHKKNLPILLEQALKQAKIKFPKKEIDLIAITYGPGLEMCLWEGITFAKELARKWPAPVIPVNHMEGHILSVFSKDKGTFKISKTNFPTLALLVSGGHTQLILIKKQMQYKIIGETLDDAVGEAFDKVARMLVLPYPGGPEISKLAEKGRAKGKQSLGSVSQADGPRGSAGRARPDSDSLKISFSFALPNKLRGKENKTLSGHNFSAEKFVQSSGRRPAESRQSLFSLPRPMLHSKDFNFSFAGLKTAVLYLIQKIGILDEKTKMAIALEFENAAVECLTHKTKKAIEQYEIKTLIVAGGVACNTHLQKEMKKLLDKKVKLLFPIRELAGDNALMIGLAGYLNYLKNKKKVPKSESIKADGNLRLG
ncbi:MAG: tRNA (adenosine(37)-N6)-threonylcarbamoyltransferase complex transferase subunit TsaD [Candidatus Peregrinibacteria bacterium]